MNVQILSFSARREGNCDGIVRAIAEHHAVDAVTVHRLAEMDISPCRECRYECFRQEACPHAGDELIPLYAALSQADLAYFVLPNYCDAPPAMYFAFNERSAYYFGGREDLLQAYLSVPKRFVVVSGSELPIFGQLLQQHAAEEPDILFLAARDYGQKSLEGRLMENEEARDKLLHWLGTHELT